MAIINRQIPPDIHREFPALTGTVTSDRGSFDIRASVLMNDNGIPILTGTGPSEWLTGATWPYSAALRNSLGWEIKCEQCFNTTVNNFSQFTAEPGRITARIGSKLDRENAACFAIFTGGDKPFCGEHADQFRRRTVVNLDCVERTGAALYGAELGWGFSEIGYCWLPTEGKSRDEDWDILNRLCLFLSLGYTRFISIPWVGVFDDKGNAEIEISGPRRPGKAGSLLYVAYPGQIGHLISRGWDVVDNEAKNLDVTHLVQQYILVRSQEFVEASVMLACVWMEAFKHQYGSEEKKYKTNKSNYFLKADGKTRYTFKELLEEGLQHYGVANPYLGFIKTRNEVIHSGTISAALPDKIAMKMELECAIEEFFFTLFKYHELVWDRKQDNWVKRA